MRGGLWRRSSRLKFGAFLNLNLSRVVVTAAKPLTRRGDGC